MREEILSQLDYTGKLLQYFTGSITTTTVSRTYAATGIESGFAVGDKVVFAGFAQTDSNGTKTIETIGTNTLTVVESIGTGETIAATMSGTYVGGWFKVNRWAKLTGVINTSGAAVVYVDQSGDNGTNVDYTSSWTVTAATALSFSIETIAKHARLRVLTTAADQTVMRAYLYGRIVT
jgi:hypothetical protein